MSAVDPAEAAADLPGPLPPGERVLWAARPAWGAVARHVFRIRVWAAALALVSLWPFAAAMAAGHDALAATPALLLFAPLAAPVFLGLGFAAWATARHTLYVVTDRRVILHVGYVFTRTVNIPLNRIRALALRPYRDGGGDLSLDLGPRPGIGYAALWPHARLWRIGRPTPTLRALPEADEAARALTAALAGAARAT